MTYKTILVHAEPGAAGEARLRLTIELARLFNARVLGLAAEGSMPMAMTGVPEADAVILETSREQVAGDLDQAERRFRSVVGSAIPDSDCIRAWDFPAVELSRHAGAADLIVCSRQGRSARASQSASGADVALSSGAPVIFPGSAGAPFRGERVVVAWKPTRETRRAVSDSLPFLMHASRTTLVAVDGDGQDVDRTALSEVAARLARHGVDVRTQVVPRGKARVAEVLESVAAREGADLIVMGAFGHSRLQEWVLGGATEDMLAACDRHVLMSH